MHRFFSLSLLKGLVSFALVTAGTLGRPSGRAENRDDIESRKFLDQLVADQMAVDDIMGASVVVVRSGQLWYERGYGFADEKRSTPVDPQLTEFHAASVSKLFVATAAMQLAEQGRLDLHRDAQYLDFRLGSFPGSRAITMTDLLTHTAGSTIT